MFINLDKMKKKNEQSSFIGFFESINIYGMPFSIRYKNKTTFSSKIGIILSIITILIILSLTLYFLIELITHSSFTILFCNDRSKLHSIDLSNIPIMFNFLDLQSNSFLINQNLFSLSVWMKHFTSIKNNSDNNNNNNGNYNNNDELIINNNYNYHVKYSKIELESCENSIYIEKYPEMKKYELNKFLCIQPNQKIEIFGRHGDLINNFTSLNIFFGYDENVVKNNLTSNLSLYENYNKVLNGAYLSIIYLSNVIDHYSHKNPIYQDFRNEVFQINKNSFKSFVYYFSSLTYMSDEGKILNCYKNYTSFIFDHLTLDFLENGSSESKMSFNNKNYSMLIKISYTLADYPIIYYRNYLKIQNIFSEIGGCIDLIFIICNFITMYFSRKKLIVDITDNLVCHYCIDACTKNNKNISKFIHNDYSNKDFLVNSSLKRHSLNLNNIKNYDLIDKNIDNNIIEEKNCSQNFSNKNGCTENNSKKEIYPRKDFGNKTLNFDNSKLNKFLNENKVFQELKINLFDYLIPYYCLRKHKKYDLLCAYTDIMYSYLSLEQILPTIEKISKLLKDKNNESFFKSKINNIFTYRKNELDEKNHFIVSKK